MSGMQWTEQEGGKGYECIMPPLAEGLRHSEMKTYPSSREGWSWYVYLAAPGTWYETNGYGCATEGKARFMAMSLVSALLQIIDGVKPHEVD